MAAILEAKHQSSHDRLLKLPEVMSRTALGRSAIYARVKSGDFPRAINLGPRAVAWSERAVDSWIAERVTASRA